MGACNRDVLWLTIELNVNQPRAMRCKWVGCGHSTSHITWIILAIPCFSHGQTGFHLLQNCIVGITFLLSNNFSHKTIG